MERIGVYYRVNRNGGTLATRTDEYSIAVAVAEERVEGGFWFRPELCCQRRFRFPPSPGWIPREVDASSVFGMFGGVEDKRQRAVSEAFERNLGDLIVSVVGRAVDLTEASDVAFYLLGPAFPKVIGRIASLRLPDRYRVHWVTPNPLPSWFEVFPSMYRCQPTETRQGGLVPYTGVEDAEQLLRTQSVAEDSLLVQSLNIYGTSASREAEFDRGPSSWEGREVHLLQSHRLPSLALKLAEDDDPHWTIHQLSQSYGELERALHAKMQVGDLSLGGADTEETSFNRGDYPYLLKSELDQISDSFKKK